MTVNEKLAMLKSLLNIADATQDASLGVYLVFAKNEIINWRYGLASGSPLARCVCSNDDSVAAVQISVFISALAPTNGDYVFAYSNADESWQYEIDSVLTDIELSDYGVNYDGTPEDAETITVTYNDRYLAEYDMVQIMACVVGYGISGAEGQTSHNENGIQRSFKYADMVAYIHQNVSPYVGVI